MSTIPGASGDMDPRMADAPLRSALESVLSQRLRAVRRLRHAMTSVCFVTPTEAVTVLLDRSPPVVAADDEPAEVEIELTAAQAQAFAAGALPLTAAIVGGQVRHRGPVRKYLEVDPILRALLGRTDGGGAGSGDAGAAVPAAGGPPDSAALDPDLLAIETRGVHKAFGSSSVLKGVDLRIPEGVISVILGPSGTGKSVLLQHILGLMSPDAGEVLVRGAPLSRMSRSELLGLRREIGVMFQDGALFSAMNVYDNVAFPLRQHSNLDEREIRRVVEQHLDGVGLAGAASRMPGELSGGMKKRAGLARALVLNPGIVLCDEPDSGLDPVRTALLGDLLVDQHAEYGGTMVVVTHNVALAQSISDHISVLWQGQVLQDGLSEQILQSDSAFVRQFLAGDTVGPLTMDA
ncbi:ABC transporter ATP-binding protein [Paraconexibacter sp. AEG42_29]|uniref:ABC transporter ATP-binding protein n=1 Tax=Paraconexibacter sp. AEG42_29 TaxID=2997339 RepID=UPI00339D80C8